MTSIKKKKNGFVVAVTERERGNGSVEPRFCVRDCGGASGKVEWGDRGEGLQRKESSSSEWQRCVRKVHLLMASSGELEQGEDRRDRGLVRKRFQPRPSKKTENTLGIAIGKF